MNKELRELLNQLENKKEEARGLQAKENVTLEEINNKTEEIKVIKAKIKALEELEPVNKPGNPAVDDMENKLDYKNVFYKALSGKKLSSEEASLLESKAALSSTTGTDGGYLIPEDEQTAINELKREMKSLESLVTVETVTTLSGSRVIEKDAAFTPFAEFTEADELLDTDSPQFLPINYSIKDRGGILPIPNNLINDNTANLSLYLRRWLAKKQVATRNNLIVTLLNTLSKTPITGFDDIKDAFNVQLDPAISEMSIAVTNQDGFNWLDKQKDSDGNYILQKDPTNPTRKLLNGKPVYVYSNKTIPNRNDGVNNHAPLIIGSIEEAVVLFDRQQMSILATNVGGTAFRKNRTEMRAITREDVQSFDSEAVVFGEIQLA